MCGAQNRDPLLPNDIAPSPCDEHLDEQRWHPQEPVWICGSGIVGTSGHKLVEMNDAFVELADDDASPASSEPETVQVHNPSLFSHRATVEDLIASFRRNIIGPLAGVDIKKDSLAASGSTHVLIISDADRQRTLDCAVEKWRVEQEEKELEMRWRATKRISENWLTKVEAMRERHKVQREKIARERELRKKKVAGGVAGGLAKDSATSQDTPKVVNTSQLHPSFQQLQPPYAVPEAGLAPSQLNSTTYPAFTSTPQPTYNTFTSQKSSSPLSASLRTTHGEGYLSASPTATATDHASSASPQFLHAPYDPRMPDLALEELIRDVVDLGLPNPLVLPEESVDMEDSETLGGMTVAEFLSPNQELILDYLHQYMDVAKMQITNNPLLPHSAPPLLAPISSLPSIHSTHHTTLPDVAEEIPTLSIQREESLLSDSPQWLGFDGWLELINTRFNPHLDHMELAALMSLIDDVGVSHGELVQGTSTRGVLHKLEPPVIVPVTPSEPTAEEKMTWRVWSLGRAPLGAGADVMLRDLEASRPSDLTPMVLDLLPEFTGSIEDAARLKLLTGPLAALEDSSTFLDTQLATMKAGWAWTSLSSTTIPLDEANTSLMLAPRSVLVNPAYSTLHSQFPLPSSQTVSNHTASQDPSASSVPPPVPASRPTPVLKTHDLPPSLRTSSYVDSPMSSISTPTSTTALFNEAGESSNSPSVSYVPCMPIGDRFFRVARVANVDVLRPSYWFEPDVTATEHIRNLVDLMEEYGGWRRPERRMRVFNGGRKAYGPDDLASFDHCFVLDIDTTVTR